MKEFVRKRTAEIERGDLGWFLRFKREKTEELLQQMSHPGRLMRRTFPVYHLR